MADIGSGGGYRQRGRHRSFRRTLERDHWCGCKSGKMRESYLSINNLNIYRGIKKPPTLLSTLPQFPRPFSGSPQMLPLGLFPREIRGEKSIETRFWEVSQDALLTWRTSAGKWSRKKPSGGEQLFRGWRILRSPSSSTTLLQDLR